MKLRIRIRNVWARFWMRYAGMSPLGRLSTRLAAWYYPPYLGRYHLANLNTNALYVSAKATIYHDNLHLGPNVFIDDGVIIFKDEDGGPVELAKGVHLHRDVIVQTGQNGSVNIGRDTHIQPRCLFSAFMAPIRIGALCEIAPNCAFYPYDHGFKPNEPIRKQPLQTKGGILIEDDVWFGFGVIVLDGVKIGKGAVIAAGAVVIKDIPEGAIAAGIPARVVKMRSDLK
jgi:acetyltransferase-like isoleucine patch superfamily enzyme